MIILSKFAERLKEFMEENGLNAPALAKQLQTDRTNITRYLRGERAPNYGNFIRMLNFFNCSADYLLGLIDYPPEIKQFKDVQPFGQRLRYVMDFCGFTQYKLEHEENFSNSAIYHWLFSNKLPTVESLVNLSESMGCSVDFLLGRID